ncbi:hypothetical protein PHYBOEH_003114 [Phytophthora boehmeriae]|uniref:Folate-Biopterin Transporter (FBT) family n=1 Tax=Phytophthora boehmeriae TaxID=109152 RepID=A0A8T1WUC1_9STRA|nr:hypothetical protein PHYBOEH_003114 [Phytophthora boehmeriae]
MPVVVLCAKLCTKGIEGTLFALLMSISNFSRSVSEFWGAIVCAWFGIAKDQYDMLWLAIVVRSVLKVVPIFFLFLVPATDPQDIVNKLDFTIVQKDADGDDDHCDTIREDHTVTDCSPTEEAEVIGTASSDEC